MDDERNEDFLFAAQSLEVAVAAFSIISGSENSGIWKTVKVFHTLENSLCFQRLITDVLKFIGHVIQVAKLYRTLLAKLKKKC